MEWWKSFTPRPQYYEDKKKLENLTLRFFLAQDFILLIGYVWKGQTIKAEYYSSLLEQLAKIFWKKTPREEQQGNIVLAQKHPAFAKQKKLPYLCFQYHDHPPNSPYLAP